MGRTEHSTTHANTRQKDVLRILLADHHALFRAGMPHLLAELDRIVQITEAGSKQEAMAALRRQEFDLILTELLLPDMERRESIALFKTLKPTTPIVVVSMADQPNDVRNAIAAGAMGFIPKSTSPEVMIEALKLVLSGSTYLPPSLLAARHDEQPRQDRKAARSANRPLSPRQAAVLAELGRGKSNKDIGAALNLSVATVKVHVTAIMRALNAQSRTQAIVAAVQRGLLPNVVIGPSGAPERRHRESEGNRLSPG